MTSSCLIHAPWLVDCCTYGPERHHHCLHGDSDSMTGCTAFGILIMHNPALRLPVDCLQRLCVGCCTRECQSWAQSAHAGAGQDAVLEAQAVHREVPHAHPGAPGARRHPQEPARRLRRGHEEVPALPGGDHQHRQLPPAARGERASAACSLARLPLCCPVPHAAKHFLLFCAKKTVLII